MLAFGGARRDEEKSRAKERIFSFRDRNHRWDPKRQRPELWSLYNVPQAKGESLRVFPLSNWTELDIWQYVQRERIAVVPLYFAAERPTVERDGLILMVDDDRLPLGDEAPPPRARCAFARSAVIRFRARLRATPRASRKSSPRCSLRRRRSGKAGRSTATLAPAAWRRRSRRAIFEPPSEIRPSPSLLRFITCGSVDDGNRP